MNTVAIQPYGDEIEREYGRFCRILELYIEQQPKDGPRVIRARANMSRGVRVLHREYPFFADRLSVERPDLFPTFKGLIE